MTETKLERRQPPKFELIGGNVCLDFVNTLDNRPSAQPKELLKNYYELTRFGEDTGILTPAQLDFFYDRAHLAPDETKEAMRRAINLRESLYAIFMAVLNKQKAPQLAMDRLNANLHNVAMHSRLVQTEGRLVWRSTTWRPPTTRCCGDLRAAADLLASSDVAHVRACSSPTCQWLFLDTSKNHHRRWCSMKQCGNRARRGSFMRARKRRAEAAIFPFTLPCYCYNITEWV